jgi:isobutyryl-CoA mutase
MRRMLQASGAEVIHLAHNRSVQEVVDAALQEDVQGIAISSYQGGHLEYFKYMVDMLRERGAGHIQVFGGGGGVIIPSEIKELHAYGVSRIYSPEDGQQMGLQGMIDDILRKVTVAATIGPAGDIPAMLAGDRLALSRVISSLERDALDHAAHTQIQQALAQRAQVPVLGITGTGGAGKSSLTDELILRLRQDSNNSLRIAVLAIDPTRRRTGGALLGDRVRMNAIYHPSVYMRSIATRRSETEVPACMRDIITAVRVSGFDLVIVETPGIGQGDAGIVPFVDASLYVMTPEFGAASQLEKIDMLDYADVIAINKFDRKGGEDAQRDVSKQVQRNRMAFDRMPDQMPVFGTIASRFNDDGVTALYQALLPVLREKGLQEFVSQLAVVNTRASTRQTAIVPPQRQRYLAEIAETVRAYRKHVEQQAVLAREIQQLEASEKMLSQAHGCEYSADNLQALIRQRRQLQDGTCAALLEQWPLMQAEYAADELVTEVRGKKMSTALTWTSMSGTRLPKVVLPGFHDHGDVLRWLCLENVPGRFPLYGWCVCLQAGG